MKWLLDSDVFSQPAKRNGHPGVIAWLAAEEPHCYTSAVVIGQLAYWVRTKKGARRVALQDWLRRLMDAFEGRTAPAQSDDRHGQRPGLPPARLEAVQSVPKIASHKLSPATRQTNGDRYSGMRVAISGGGPNL
jgi:hypothetical protein